MKLNGCLIRLIIFVIIMAFAWPILLHGSRFAGQKFDTLRKSADNIDKVIGETIKDLKK